MIREERNPAFWQTVADHPDVAPHLGGVFNAQIVTHPQVMPLASENGGYLFVRLDALGRVWDLHASFLPKGWGREANIALKASLNQLPDWQIVTVSEVETNRRSQPPRSFGFRPAGGFEGGYRSWILTRTAWASSPAHRRTE